MDTNLVSLLITTLALFLAWTAFKKDRQEKRDALRTEKEDILASVESELGYMSLWLKSSYNSSNLSDRFWHPFSMVYRLGRNEAIKSIISGKSLTLLSNELCSLLVEFNQRLSNFEQHIDRAMSLITADPILMIDAAQLLDNISSEDLRLKYIKDLYRKYSSSEQLTRPEKFLLIIQNVMQRIHSQGIGDISDPLSLSNSFNKLESLIGTEKGNIFLDVRWRSPFWYLIFDIVVWLSTISVAAFFVLKFLNIQKGNAIILTMDNNFTAITLTIIFIFSLILGFIKYGSTASSRKGWAWQLNFVELWNSFINFFISGLLGYYFIFVRWQQILKGGSPSGGDFAVLILFAMGLFGHLSVLSKNITEGINAILKRVLEG